MDFRKNEPAFRSQADDAAHQTADYLRSHSADEMADDVRAKADEMADDVRAKADKIADGTRAKADEITGAVREKAEEVGAQVSGKINTAMNGTGKKISNLAQKVRDRAPAGSVGEAASATADAIDRGGSYLQDQDVEGVRANLEKIIRRYPLRSLLISAIISFLLARRMPR